MTAPSIVTRVRSVVVHGNGALVTRTGRVAAGAGEVLIEGLPLLFAADTLRVRPRDASVVVGVVDEVCRVGVVPAPPPAGEEALLEVRIRLSALELQKRTLKTLLQHADVRVELPPKDVDGQPDLAALLRLHQSADRRRRGLVSELRALEDAQRALRKEEKQLQQQARPDEKPPRVLRGLRVGLQRADDAAFDLDVEYFVAAARWVPSYALHLTSAADQPTRARLVLGALVAQATGEDWDDVELRVSTVDLRRETTLPVLHSWRMGRAQAARARGFRPLPSDLPTLFSGWDRFPSAPTPPTTTPPTTTMAPTTTATTPTTLMATATTEHDYQMRSEGELKSFEHQRTDAALPALDRLEQVKKRGGRFDDSGAGLAEEREAALGEDGEDDADEVSAAPHDRRAPMAELSALPAKNAPFGGFAAQAAPTLARASSAPPPPKAGSAGGMMFVKDLVAPGAAPSQAPLVVDELPPRLRTSALRMAGPGEAQRGLLLPLDAQKRLEWLLDAADLSAVGAAGDDGAHHELRRAITALDEAARRLRSRPLPRGTVGVGGNAVSAVYGQTSRASIPGDGNDHRVEVHEDSGDVGIVHLAVPRESLDVWRACRFQPKGALPPGPVQVYENGAFVVRAHVDGGGGGKVLTINLGVDPDVRIKARTPTALQSEKGMLGGTTHMEHKVVTELRSTKSVRVELRLFDRVPTADEHQRDVLVSPLSSKPPPAVVDKGPKDETLKGGVRFDVVLMPGESRTIEHSYTITLPAKSEVVGGNRRE